MPPGTKNRLKITSDACKEHLRKTYASQAALVEEFIEEVEGRDGDVTRWQTFTDPSWNTGKMLQRVDERFQGWLKGDGL